MQLSLRLCAPCALIFAMACTLASPPARRADIPTHLLDGYEGLVVFPATADEGVDLAPSQLERMSREVRQCIGEWTAHRLAPPVLAPDDEFRGHVAELHVVIARCEEVSVEARFRAPVTQYEVDTLVLFVDAETLQPLSDWVDLGEAAGPALGRSPEEALSVAADQVARHVVRDRRG